MASWFDDEDAEYWDERNRVWGPFRRRGISPGQFGFRPMMLFVGAIWLFVGIIWLVGGLRPYLGPASMVQIVMGIVFIVLPFVYVPFAFRQDRLAKEGLAAWKASRDPEVVPTEPIMRARPLNESDGNAWIPGKTRAPISSSPPSEDKDVLAEIERMDRNKDEDIDGDIGEERIE